MIVGVLFIAVIKGGKTPTTEVIPTIPPIASPTITITPPVREGWKYYQNVKYGYSIEYPTNWTVRVGVSGVQGDDSKLETTGQIAIYAPADPEREVRIWIGVRKTLYPTVSDFMSSLTNPEAKGGSVTIYSKSRTLIDGSNAYIYVRSQPGVGKELALTTIRNGYEYSIVFDNPDKFRESRQMFDQLVSTFKFTSSETK